MSPDRCRERCSGRAALAAPNQERWIRGESRGRRQCAIDPRGSRTDPPAVWGGADEIECRRWVLGGRRRRFKFSWWPCSGCRAILSSMALHQNARDGPTGTNPRAMKLTWSLCSRHREGAAVWAHRLVPKGQSTYEKATHRTMQYEKLKEASEAVCVGPIGTRERYFPVARQI